jgi:hypothetical protein
MKRIAAGLAALLLCAAPAAAQNAGSGIAGAWDRGATAGTPFRTPESGGPGPVLRLAGSTQEGAQLGDPKAPILLPWAADVLRQRAENDRAGVMQAEAKESCSPMGVPHILQLNGPIMILPGRDVTLITYQRALQARLIHMNQQHPANLAPSYYGHSVGHWEGDTLVVDTVGFNDKTPVDMYGTPHTVRLHVVERYRVMDGGKRLRVDFTVMDPGAFTTAWSSFADYGPLRAPYEAELVCAENNRLPDGRLVPMPMDDTPDF